MSSREMTYAHKHRKIPLQHISFCVGTCFLRSRFCLISGISPCDATRDNLREKRVYTPIKRSYSAPFFNCFPTLFREALTDVLIDTKKIRFSTVRAVDTFNTDFQKRNYYFKGGNCFSGVWKAANLPFDQWKIVT